MEKTELNIEDFEIVKIERKDGIFTLEDGKQIPYKNYYVYIKNVNNPLIMRAKLDKVFNEYVEYTD
ncbi:MAG: hypothetical protein IJL02_11755 [Methanobrevibacter sp.]|uniref:hypothetical protein n=1 Tax=Methanobrevibacter sp. TaxID=66852 RepID=UPI0025CD91FF|nr:hypothetical protein [Methanobrevibacter sp.]MBQ6100521.1 hypothetical protein [Methanobrevibacter sp.]